MRTCNSQDNVVVSLKHKNITCPVCHEPTVYESAHCQSFLNHRRVCHGEKLPSDAFFDNDNKFFLSTNRSLNYDGQSLLQSAIHSSNVRMNDDIIFNNNDCDYDYINESNDEMNISKDDDKSSRILPFSERTQLLPYAIFSVRVHNIISKHGAPLSMYDNIMSLMNSYVQSDSFGSQPPLMLNNGLQNHIERVYQTKCLKPFHRVVSLSNGSKVTVPTFDIESMILSILSHKTLMNNSNYAPGYNIFSGKKVNNHPHNEKYGEIHTGKAWDSARSHYCGENYEFMPIALIVFGDKSHTDLHGALSLTPIIFTLSFFSRAARNKVEFWRPAAYVPNLSFSKGESDSTLSVTKVQDEHICLAAAFQSVIDINRKGGIQFYADGKLIHAKVWIHYFIGDTEGNNKWLGHYNSSNQGVAMPYRDCKCTFNDMDNTAAKCQYFQLADMAAAVTTISGQMCKETYRSISKHPIKNALLQPDLPLSDIIHGPYRMMPPELLHTSGSGLIMYMFESLRDMIETKKSRELLDELHIQLSLHLQRQSERDFPCGSIRNGIIDGTKIQSIERRGNLFRLLCLAHTTSGRNALIHGVWNRSITDLDENEIVVNYEKQWKDFLKLYLSLEEWFHDENLITEVDESSTFIAKVLKDLKLLFPRSGGNGYKIPKFHGMMKMKYYIQLFGSGMNFFGGPGESHHKSFVKGPGQQTQRRFGEFAVQVANRVYEDLIYSTAQTICDDSFQIDDEKVIHAGKKTDNVDCISTSGCYELRINGVDNYSVVWNKDNKKKNMQPSYQIDSFLVRMIIQQLTTIDIIYPCTLFGYTEISLTMDEGTCIFRAHPSYRGKPWYDWAYIEFVEEDILGEDEQRLYPSKILGFVEMPHDKSIYSVVQCSMKHMSWNKLLSKFIVPFNLGTNFNISYAMVPVSSIVHPLAVFPDYGNNDTTSFFVVLPKRNWTGYFSSQLSKDNERKHSRKRKHKS